MASISFAPWSTPLPGTSFPRWDGMLQYTTFSSESIDAAIKTWVNWDDAVPQPGCHDLARCPLAGH